VQGRTPFAVEIAEALGREVVGQEPAVRELSIALSKHLAGLATGNVLMIGSSGTGKTMLMRAIERYLAGEASLARHSTLIRVHANVLAEQTREGRTGQTLLLRLLERAREVLGRTAGADELLERVAHGIVFVDEVDKIRASVGGEPHVAGIRAQEALLTLVENEAVPLELPAELCGGSVTVDASGLLFVCAGAFEGLYDSVYERVTVGRDHGALHPWMVVDRGEIREEMRFALRDWLRSEDLFDYGMTPQFLSRFDGVVLLNDLSVEQMMRIFLERPESGLHQARAYFGIHGIELSVSPEAVRRIAVEAARQPRLGARALNEVFRRVIRDYEFDPGRAAVNGSLQIGLPEIEQALAPPT
jgi:ATP-dependent Clp protease ATP-binding subunit ClpX